jgi:hypothetical protein
MTYEAIKRLGEANLRIRRIRLAVLDLVWNMCGMLLAVPMLVIAKSICDRVEALKPIGELLGD